MKRVTIVENGKSSSEAEQDDEKYSYKNGFKWSFLDTLMLNDKLISLKKSCSRKKSKGRRNSVIPASSKTSSTRKTRSKHAMTSSSDSSDDGSSSGYDDRDKEARRHEKCKLETFIRN